MSNGDLLQSQLEYTLTKDTLLTPKRQITADFDSNSLLGVFSLVCHKAKYYLPSPLFSSDNQNNQDGNILGNGVKQNVNV
jgi:hypothetical protein